MQNQDRSIADVRRAREIEGAGRPPWEEKPEPKVITIQQIHGKHEAYRRLLQCLRDSVTMNAASVFTNCSGCGEQGLCTQLVHALQFNYQMLLTELEVVEGRANEG